MVYPNRDTVSLISRAFILRAGDLLATGTPSGGGYARTPPWLSGLIPRHVVDRSATRTRRRRSMSSSAAALSAPRRRSCSVAAQRGGGIVAWRPPQRNSNAEQEGGRRQQRSADGEGVPRNQPGPAAVLQAEPARSGV